MLESNAGAAPTRETPKWTGILTHRDPKGRFSVRFATDWAWFVIDEPIGTAVGATREGVGAYPNPEDPNTLLTMWVAPLDVAVRAEDYPELAEGVDAGLSAHEECQVLATEDVTIDNLLKFVRVYTFRDGEVTRKRQQWLIYAHTWLFCLTWQGSTVEEYEYWYAMANQTFHTMDLPQELMFATDRDFADVYESPKSAEAGETLEN
jgi:hypothetical protein